MFVFTDLCAECDENAICGEGTKYTCECKKGFTGDGKECVGEWRKLSAKKQYIIDYIEMGEETVHN